MKQSFGLTTNYAKNYCIRTLIVKVIVENVVTCFFGTRCSMTTNHSGPLNTCHATASATITVSLTIILAQAITELAQVELV